MGGRKNEHTWPEKNLIMNEGSRERFNTYMSFSLLDQKPSEISGPAHILHLISYRKKHGISGWVRDLVLSGACHCCEKGFTFSSSRVGWTISSLQSLSPQEGKDGVFEINLVEFGQSGSLQGLCPEAQQGMVEKGGFLHHILTGFSQACSNYDQAFIHSVLQVVQRFFVGWIVHHQDTDLVVTIVAVLPHLGPDCLPRLGEQYPHSQGQQWCLHDPAHLSTMPPGVDCLWRRGEPLWTAASRVSWSSLPHTPFWSCHTGHRGRGTQPACR